jgi:hypothetical protein
MNKLLHWTLLMTLGAGLHAQPQASNWILGFTDTEELLMLSFDADSVHLVELGTTEPEWAGDEGMSCISDSSGSLLYYSSSINTYNSSNESLFNSGEINGDALGLASTITSGSMILTMPGDTLERFHVLLTIREAGPQRDRLQWSLIDRQGDGGLGAVVDSLKGINVWPNRIQEKQAAVRHANGRDWWILARSGRLTGSPGYHILESDSFLLALLTPKGIALTKALPAPVHTQAQFGQLVFSRDGRLLAESSSGNVPYEHTSIGLYQFDRCTGDLALLDSVSAQKGLYSVAFDDPATRLYASSFLRLSVDQYSISGDTLLTPVKVFGGSGGSFQFGGMLSLANNNKIYMTMFGGNALHPYSRHLAVIDYPSNAGSACGFDPLGISIGTYLGGAGLPVHPNYALGALEGSGCDTLGSTSSAGGPAPPVPWTLYPNPARDRAWLEGLPEGSSWLLVDVLGRSLRSGFARQGRASMELDGLARGMYLVVVQAAGRGPMARRLVVSGP